MPYDAETQRIHDKIRERKGQKTSKYATRQRKFEGSLEDVAPAVWYAAIASVLEDGCCLSFATTYDKEAVVITVLDRGTPVKSYCHSASEVCAALETLAATAAQEARTSTKEQVGLDAAFRKNGHYKPTESPFDKKP